MDIIGKDILISSFTKTIETIIEKLTGGFIEKKLSNEKRIKICEAIISIKDATDETRKFISVSGYQTNTNLTKLWRHSLQKAVAADINENLEDFLYHKADFWENPQQWLANPSSLELVPKLIDLDQKCDILLEMIKRK